MKEIVQLRHRPDKNGGQSLYLCYYIDGIRKYESLKLNLIPEIDVKSKKANKVTMEVARTIQAQRIVEVQMGKANIKKNKTTDMVDYFKSYIVNHNSSAAYTKAMRFALQHWTDTFGNKKNIESITKKDMMKFSEHLKKEMKQSSAAHYYNIISTVLQSAWRDEIIDKNPAKLLEKNEKPKMGSDRREFLTMEELSVLAGAHCPSEVSKKAFMFSCFTGLRLSDIHTLTWDMIKGDNIIKKQVKTGEDVIIPLSENAKKWLPEKGKGLVFTAMSERQEARYIKKWLENAGIDKHITFHCARHTFACLLLSYGTDIYTTSKLLGHTSVATTEIYAHLIDKKKREAVDMIPELKK